jgi:hypothetical protein
LIKGNKYFSEAIEEDESIDMEKIYDSLDIYRVGLAKIVIDKIDVELEAIFLSKLGYIFYKINRRNEKAKEYLNNAVNLGLSLYPRNISLERWYIKASTTLEEIIKTLQKDEDETIRKSKQKYLDEIKDDLIKLDDELEKVKKDNNNLADFLKYVIKKHSPIKNKFELDVDEEIKNTNPRKILLKIIKFYHPDKNGLEEMKDKIIIEEISKRLNDIYSIFKGMN